MIDGQSNDPRGHDRHPVRRVVICATQVPFAWGGAEILVECLREQLRARGFEAEIVTLPFQWPQRVDLAKAGLAWRLLDLRQVGGKRVDLVIGTRFPSYLVRHPSFFAASESAVRFLRSH